MADDIQLSLSMDDAKTVMAWQRQKANLAEFEKQMDSAASKAGDKKSAEAALALAQAHARGAVAAGDHARAIQLINDALKNSNAGELNKVNAANQLADIERQKQAAEQKPMNDILKRLELERQQKEKELAKAAEEAARKKAGAAAFDAELRSRIAPQPTGQAAEQRAANQTLAIAQAQARAAIATGDHAKAASILQKALDGSNASMKAKLAAQTQLADVERKMSDSGTSFLSSVGAIGVSLLGVSTVMGAISKAASLVTSELDNAVSRQKDAALALLPLAALKDEMYNNLGVAPEWGDTLEKQKRTADQKVKVAAAKAGVSESVMHRVFTKTLSAKSEGDTAETMLEASILGAKASPRDVEQAGSFSAAAMDLRAGDEKISPQSAMGVILATGAMSRINEIKKVGETLAPVYAAGKSYGMNIKEVSSLVGMTSSKMNDTEGDKTKTSDITLMRDVMSAAPGAKTFDEALKRVIASSENAKADIDEVNALELNFSRTAEQTKRLNDLKTKHAAFLSIADKGEAGAFPMRRSLLTGGEAYETYENLKKNAVGFEEGGKRFEEDIASRQGSKPAIVGKLENIGAGMVEGLKTGDAGLSDAVRSQVREIKANIRKAAGDSALDQWWESTKDWAYGNDNNTPEQSAQELLESTEERIKELKSPKYVRNYKTGTHRTIQPTDSDIQKAETLESYLPDLIEVLQSLRKDGVRATVKQVPDQRNAPAQRPAQAVGAGT